MRVLVVDPILSSLPYDRALCAALVAKGHQVKMVGRNILSNENWSVPNVNYISLPIEDVIRQTSLSGNILRIYTLFRHIRYSLQISKIETVVEEFKPEIIHFQWCLTPVAEIYLIRRLRKRAAVLLTVHDTNPFNGSKVSSFVTRGLHTLMTRFDHLIVHTRSAAQILIKRGFLDKELSVIPHGLLQSPATDVAATLNLRDSTDCPFVTCLLFGHLKYYKGVDVLIRAAALLSDNTKRNLRFVVAGQLGVDFAELERLCEANDIGNLFRFELKFFPETEVDALMRTADLFVFPYREIQASGIFTLALQYGRPVVASDLGIFSERIKDGANGFLVPPDDPVSLASALTQLSDDPKLRRMMGEANLEMSRNYPTWAEIAHLTTNAYEEAQSHWKHSVRSDV